jgi:hypothetical protein
LIQVCSRVFSDEDTVEPCGIAPEFTLLQMLEAELRTLDTVVNSPEWWWQLVQVLANQFW